MIQIPAKLISTLVYEATGAKKKIRCKRKMVKKAKIAVKQKSAVQSITSHQFTLSTTVISALSLPPLLSAAHKPSRISSSSSDSMAQSSYHCGEASTLIIYH